MFKQFLLLLWLLLLPAGNIAAAAAPPTFADVQPGSWYYQAVSQAAQTGWLAGYPDGSFQPEAAISAAEFVSVTARAADLSAPSGQVQNSHWAGPALQSALEAHWYDWDELPPTAELYDRPISRQLAVKILMQAMLPEARGDYNSQNAKISDFSALPGRYYEPVLAAYQTGTLTGDADGRFRPQDSLSRAEACALLLRASQISGDASRPGNQGNSGNHNQSNQSQPKAQPSFSSLSAAASARTAVCRLSTPAFVTPRASPLS